MIKMSGEMLSGAKGFGFDKDSISSFASEIRSLTERGILPSLVIGGGNFFRGARSSLPDLKRHHADDIGMIATIMNALCFADHLESISVRTEIFSAIGVDRICRRFNADDARRSLAEGKVCLFAGGTGNPYFSTDTAAALRAVEVGCDLLIKATKVDGVYDDDPMSNPNAVKYDRITYSEVLDRKLGVMDLAAISLCRENAVPLLVLSLSTPGCLLKACMGTPLGTRVAEK